MALVKTAPAAYTVVDISGYSRQDQDALKSDALKGGHLYGLTIVEYIVQGNVTSAIFGHYNDDAAKKLWAETQKELTKAPTPPPSPTEPLSQHALAAEPGEEDEEDTPPSRGGPPRRR